jgi:hypothetical protein
MEGKAAALPYLSRKMTHAKFAKGAKSHTLVAREGTKVAKAKMNAARRFSKETVALLQTRVGQLHPQKRR